MARQQLRSVLVGLAVMASPMSFMAQAQDYVDVEAERAAAARAAAAERPQSPQGQPSQPSQPSQGGTVSYGVGAASPATTRMLPPPAPPTADNVGGLFNQVQQLQQEVMRLNGVVEELRYELSQLKEQSLERYLDLDQRLAGGAAPAVVPPGGAASAVAPTATASGAAEVQEQPGEGDAYRSAYALVRGQEFDAAVVAFKQFLDRFPAGRYAPNAHYWLGELYLVVDPPDPEAARQSFMLLLTQYPDNAKIPDALYKLGRVHFIKGNSARAREFLNRTISEYPNSSAARLAGDFLDQNF